MGYSVLIVDDKSIICVGLQKLVDWAEYGFTRVDIKFSFEDGVKAALSHPYTLIITDIRLRKQSGLDLIRIVKEHGKCDSFMVISAFAEFEYAKTALEFGVRQYLLKPLNRDEVVRSIASFAASMRDGTPGQAGAMAAPSREEREEQAGGASKKNVRVMDVMSYIHKHYADKDLTLTQVAQKLYVNPSYLGQCFRSQTGIKFTDYANQYRIVKACDLFMDDKLLTYEICNTVGYSSISYFHRMFKRVTGLSTEEYRKKAVRGEVKIDFSDLNAAMNRPATCDGKAY